MRLTKDFFLAPATELAPKLLGKYLCRKTQNGVIKLVITETECYFGEDDTACHAHKGKTNRTAPLYEEGGIAYVYLCYGIHSLFNVVTGAENHPEAVLIRGLKGFSGPGRLTKALNITLSLNKTDLCSSDELWLEDGDSSNIEFTASKRIGIDYATQEYRDKLWNYKIV